MERVRKILIPILLVVFLFSGWKVITLGREYAASRNSYSQLEQYVSLQTEAAASTAPEHIPESSPETTAPEETSEQEQIPWPVVDFEALAQINPDIVGWICIPDTQINYPIVHRDNVYYMDRMFDGTYNAGGCIFLEEDCLPDFSGPHNILYGHHMRDGSMFAGISKFRDQTYYDAHPLGLLLTPNGNHLVEFFSGYVSATYETAWQLEFVEGEYPAWLEDIARRSLFYTAVVPDSGDRILTLSTCSYEFENARFVLHGVIVE